MKKFPTVEALANAELDEVNEEWAGLGYYRRAKHLHSGAKKVMEEYNGIIPNTSKDLLSLPGIGKYTAGAIASIVFGESVPVVDGNVIRVISRLRMISEDPKVAKTQKIFWDLTGQVVDKKRPGCFNQAVMDLGASLCSVKAPECSKCPLQKECKVYQASIDDKQSVLVTDYPTKVKKAAPRLETIYVCVFYVMDESSNGDSNIKYLIVQRPAEGLLASMWEFPTCNMNSEKVASLDGRRTLFIKYFTDNLGVKSKLPESRKKGQKKGFWNLGKTSHIFSHIKQTLYVDACELSSEFCTKESNDSKINYRWVSSEELENAALSKGMRKCHKLFTDNCKSSQTSIASFFSKK